MAHEGEQTTIRLLICDDHKVLTDALALIVGSDPDIQLVADPVQDPTGSVRSSSTWPPAIANEAIGSDLFISPRTVQTHVRNIVRQLHVHSKLEAVALAVKLGEISAQA